MVPSDFLAPPPDDPRQRGDTPRNQDTATFLREILPLLEEPTGPVGPPPPIPKRRLARAVQQAFDSKHIGTDKLAELQVMLEKWSGKDLASAPGISESLYSLFRSALVGQSVKMRQQFPPHLAEEELSFSTMQWHLGEPQKYPPPLQDIRQQQYQTESELEARLALLEERVRRMTEASNSCLQEMSALVDIIKKRRSVRG